MRSGPRGRFFFTCLSFALALSASASAQSLAGAQFWQKWGQSVPFVGGTFGFSYGSAVNSATGEVFVTDGARVQVFDRDGNFLRYWFCPNCYGIDVNPVNGDVYVGRADTDRVAHYTSLGAFVGDWGGLGTGNGTFNYPSGIAVDPATGNVYVRDSFNALVQEFDATGTFIRQFGGVGTAPGQFLAASTPAGIAFDPVEQAVYAVDPAARTITKFDAQGNYLLRWGGGPASNTPGQFRWIRSVAVDPAGVVYVADTDNDRISVFTSQGVFVRLFQGPNNVAAGPFHPRDIAINLATGEKYVNAAYAFRMDKFDAADGFVLSWGTRQTAGYYFENPRGIAVSPVGDDVYVFDSENFLIKRFSSAGVFRGQWGGSVNVSPAIPGLFGFVIESALAVDPDANVWTGLTGLIYADDPPSLYVQKFDPAGVNLLAWPRMEQFGSQFENQIRGVAVDPQTRQVWLTDSWYNRVRRHSTSGALELSLPGFSSPAGIALGNGSVYVIEAGLQRIRRLDPNGAPLGSFGAPGSAPGQFDFDGSSALTVGPNGDLYVADSWNNRIQRFDAAGNFLDALATTRGNAPGELSIPMGVALSPNGNLLFVADTYNDRVQSFCLTNTQACLGEIDTDGDTRFDATDNCRYAPNSPQDDTGGVASLTDPNGETPDGIGDVCQCGAVSPDGDVDLEDRTLLRDYLADPSTPIDLARCSVYGPAGCDIVDWVVLERAAQGLLPGARQVCAAALPAAP